MFRLEPFPKALVAELVIPEKTESGIFLPDGTKPEETDDYSGEILIAVGSAVQEFSAGDKVMFFSHAQPSLVKIKEDDGKVHTYMFFRESDVVCKVH